MKRIGNYPTPVERIEALKLWVKRDDLTNPLYGGNKVRKLEHLIAEAERRGKTRLITVGAAGSHHVLATAIHGGAAGLAVEAAIVPQPRTEHVIRNLRADLAVHATLHPARTFFGAAISMLAHYRSDAYLVPMGGSNVIGSMGYVDAVRELAAQVRCGELPEPDAIVVTVGSGGTAAGILAGLALEKMRAHVIGIVVAVPVAFVSFWTRRLARAVYAKAGGTDRLDLDQRFTLLTNQLGKGYGEPTIAGRDAQRIGADHGLHLDLTYTAKCFAGALECVQSARYSNVLYWHTLSSAPLDSILAKAPELPPRLDRFLH